MISYDFLWIKVLFLGRASSDANAILAENVPTQEAVQSDLVVAGAQEVATPADPQENHRKL